MLTNDLVRVRVRQGEVHPQYVDTGDRDLLSLAESLIDIFRRAQGGPREELEGELTELLGTGTAFLLHRGLAKLLFDRCSFEVEAAGDPLVVRRAVFLAAANAYRGESETSKPFDRETVLAQAAATLQLEPQEVESSLYADLKDHQVLSTFKALKAVDLLRRFNTATAQAVLLRARDLQIDISAQPVARYRALFRKIKFFQLLHRVETLNDGYRIHLDGPLSMFKASNRYGLQMASFLPTLLHFHGWQLTARLLWGRDRKECLLRISPKSGLEPHNRLTGQWQPEELTFLPQQMAKIAGDWQVSTEAEIVPLGNQGLLVPDYAFTHTPSGQRVFMEVFGFWNKGSVSSRLRLLRDHGPKNLIVAMSRSLATDPEALEALPTEIYLFRKAPVARQVLELLRRFEP